MGHLFVRQIEEAGENHEDIRLVQRLQAGNLRRSRLDEAVLVHPEDDGAFEAVVLGEDAGEGGTGFLGAVFVVAGEEDDVLAYAGAGLALIDDGGGMDGRGGEYGGDEQAKGFHFDFGVGGDSSGWSFSSSSGFQKIERSFVSGADLFHRFRDCTGAAWLPQEFLT